jgi:hypothetical protein
MKRYSCILVIFVLFLSGCKDLEHCNILDPDYSGFKDIKIKLSKWILTHDSNNNKKIDRLENVDFSVYFINEGLTPALDIKIEISDGYSGSVSPYTISYSSKQSLGTLMPKVEKKTPNDFTLMVSDKAPKNYIIPIYFIISDANNAKWQDTLKITID